MTQPQTHCISCRLPFTLCICAQTPHLDLKTRIIIFMHHKEFRLITNTGVLARRVLKNSDLVFRGYRKAPPVTAAELGIAVYPVNTFLLYPSNGAQILDTAFLDRYPGPLTLICPDGHWGQARKIINHEKALKGLPCVKLPDGLVSNYRLRRNPVLGRVCTFEAVAQALGIIEGTHVQKVMEEIFLKMTTRILWTRGKIAFSEIV